MDIKNTLIGSVSHLGNNSLKLWHFLCPFFCLILLNLAHNPPKIIKSHTAQIPFLGNTNRILKYLQFQRPEILKQKTIHFMFEFFHHIILNTEDLVVSSGDVELGEGCQ